VAVDGTGTLFRRPGANQWGRGGRRRASRGYQGDNRHLGRRRTVTGFSGDGGSPRNAELSGSLNTGIAIGPDGSLYIADTDNNRVRKVDPAGTTITTVAGTGSSTYSGDGGAAASAGVPRPESVAVDAAGNLYIGNNTSVRKVSPNLIINAYAGTAKSASRAMADPPRPHRSRELLAWRWIPEATCTSRT